jgi:tRNA (guanine37-N1)-methyltransferase
MAFDVVGDIAIVEPGTDGQAILEQQRNVNVVLAKKGDVEGEYRIREYEIIASRPEARNFDDIPAIYRPRKLTETVHRENACRFKVDPTEAYFSVRLSTERERIAKLVRAGEKVLVMFAGIGPYPIVIARLADPDMVAGIEVNPYAIRYFQENIAINKMEGKVKALEGDVKDVVPKMKEQFDRVIMPLPKESETFLYLALKKVRPGGMIHLYKICHENDVDAFLQSVKKSLGKAEITVVKAGEYAPGAFRYCFDIKLSGKPARR